MLTPNQSANSLRVSPRNSLTLASRALERSFHRFLISTAGPLGSSSDDFICFVDNAIDAFSNGGVYVDVIEFKTPAHLSGKVSKLGKFEITGIAESARLRMLDGSTPLTSKRADSHSGMNPQAATHIAISTDGILAFSLAIAVS